MNKILKHKLVSRLKGFEQESKTLRYRIKKLESKKFNASSLRYTKDIIGEEARYHLLAYAFFKGIPYKNVEIKCRENNKPNSDRLLNTIRNIHNLFNYTSIISNINEVKEWLGEEIKIIPIIETPIIVKDEKGIISTFKKIIGK